MNSEQINISRPDFLGREVGMNEIHTPEDFSPEHKNFFGFVKNFVKNEILPFLPEIESQQWDVVLALFRKAGKEGILSAGIPKQLGGLGMDMTGTAILGEAIGSLGSFANMLGVHVWIGTFPLVFFGTAEQKKRYLPRLASGELISSFAITELTSGGFVSISTNATQDSSGKYYFLNGTKKFITNSGIAGIYQILTKVNHSAYTFFIVEKGYEGISIGNEENKLGIKGASNRMIYMKNAKVPIENILGSIGIGHHIASGILALGRSHIAAAAVGAAKEAIKESVIRAQSRQYQGTPISKLRMIKYKLGEMGIRTFVSETMLYRVMGEIERRISPFRTIDPGPIDPLVEKLNESLLESSMIKVYTTENLAYVVDEEVQIFGGYGFLEDYPPARRYRDARITRIYEGTNEMLRLIIAQSLLMQVKRKEIPIFSDINEIINGTSNFSQPFTTLIQELKLQKIALFKSKKIALYLARLIFERDIKKVFEEQELLGCISDAAVEIYAMESVLLRVEKILLKNTENKGDLYQNIAKAVVHDCLVKIENCARTILYSLYTPENAFSCYETIRKFFSETYVDLIGIKNTVADRIISSGDYSL